MCLIAHGVLNRNSQIHPVLVVEIDVVHTKAIEACLAARPHVLRLPVDLEVVSFVLRDAKFSGKLDLFSRQMLQRLRKPPTFSSSNLKSLSSQFLHEGERERSNLSDQYLVCVRSVGVGGVEESDAPIEHLFDDAVGFFLTVRRAEDPCNAVAPETQSRNLKEKGKRRGYRVRRPFLSFGSRIENKGRREVHESDTSSPWDPNLTLGMLGASMASDRRESPELPPSVKQAAETHGFYKSKQHLTVLK